MEKQKKDGICFVWKILKLKGLLVPRLNQQIHTHRETHIRHRDIERDTHTSGFSLCLSLCLRQYCIFNGLQLDSHPNLFMSHIFVGQGMFVLCWSYEISLFFLFLKICTALIFIVIIFTKIHIPLNFYLPLYKYNLCYFSLLYFL